MSDRARDLSKRIVSVRDEAIEFVERLTGEDWEKTCKWEDWPAGVTACHIGAGHFGIADMLKKIIAGEELPQLTMEQINEMSDKEAKKLSGCSKAEALDLLQKNGTELAAFVVGLSDDELDRKGSMPAFGGEATVEQVIGAVIFQSARQHLESIRAAVGKSA